MASEHGSGWGRVGASQRGAVVVAAAAILCYLILSHTSPTTSTLGTAKPVVTTTTRAAAPTTATTAPLAAHDPTQVPVLVLNGVDPKKTIAGPAAKTLVAAGFSQTTGADAAKIVTASAVYFTAGYDQDAARVASLLGLSPALVQPLPTPVPAAVGDPKGATVIVVYGPDVPAPK